LSKKYLPQEIVHQPKRGFEVPIKKWVENDIRDNNFDSLTSNSYSQNFIDKNFIDNVLNKKVDISDERRARILWNMYTLEIWNRNK
jgi:asparagine synthase (glutamine-hydrolysing)